MKGKDKSKGGLPPEIVSANEFTGSLQHIAPDPEHLKKFQKEFNGDK